MTTGRQLQEVWTCASCNTSTVVRAQASGHIPAPSGWRCVAIATGDPSTVTSNWERFLICLRCASVLLHNQYRLRNLSELLVSAP